MNSLPLTLLALLTGLLAATTLANPAPAAQPINSDSYPAPTPNTAMAGLFIETFTKAGCKGSKTGSYGGIGYGSWYPGQFRSFSLSRNLADNGERLSFFNSFRTGNDDKIEPETSMSDIGSENGFSALCMEFKINIMGNQKKQGCHTLGTPAYAGCFRITEEPDNGGF